MSSFSDLIHWSLRSNIIMGFLNKQIDGGAIGGGTYRPRYSTDRNELSRLPGNVDPAETRYYRSAEFQQALLQREMERSFAEHNHGKPPTSRDQKRLSRMPPPRGANVRHSMPADFSPYHGRQEAFETRVDREETLDEAEGREVDEDRERTIPEVPSPPSCSSRESTASASGSSSKGSSETPRANKRQSFMALRNFGRSSRMG